MPFLVDLRHIRHENIKARRQTDRFCCTNVRCYVANKSIIWNKNCEILFALELNVVIVVDTFTYMYVFVYFCVWFQSRLSFLSSWYYDYYYYYDHNVAFWSALLCAIKCYSKQDFFWVVLNLWYEWEIVYQCFPFTFHLFVWMFVKILEWQCDIWSKLEENENSQWPTFIFL